MFGIEERHDDGVADDGGGSEDEEQRRPGMAGDAIGNRGALGNAAKRKNGSAESVEIQPMKMTPPINSANLPAHASTADHGQRDDGGGGRVKARMDLSEF